VSDEFAFKIFLSPAKPGSKKQVAVCRRFCPFALKQGHENSFLRGIFGNIWIS
jgi:hypothetical protein